MKYDDTSCAMIAPVAQHEPSAFYVGFGGLLPGGSSLTTLLAVDHALIAKLLEPNGHFSAASATVDEERLGVDEQRIANVPWTTQFFMAHAVTRRI